MSSRELELFLARPHVARVASAGRDLAPYVTPVWYEWRNRAIRFVLAQSRPHVRNLRENPRVAICIDEDSRVRDGVDGHAEGATLTGNAQLSEPVALGADDRIVTPVFLRIAAHYLGGALGTIEAQPEEILHHARVLVTVRPEKIVSWRAPN